MIIGHGVDIVETSRIEQLLGDHPERFLERVFTPGEQADSESNKRQLEHLAARFAAKEAALKALARRRMQARIGRPDLRGATSWPPTGSIHGRP